MMISLTVPDIRDEDIRSASEVLRSGMLVQGEQVQQLERTLGEYVGAAHVIAVSSGTAALHLSLVALGIGPGDAVLVPAFSFVATANAVKLTGATPVFVDVSADDYNIDIALLEQTIETYTGDAVLKAVMPVHEFGSPADMESICSLAEKHGLLVVEDAACALGARLGDRHAGTFGSCGCFSLHPRKSLTTGEGGLIAVEDDALAEKIRLLRSHGVIRNSDGRIDCIEAGYNYRMTDFQAALAVSQMTRFDANLKARRAIAEAYDNALRQSDGFAFPEKAAGHAWQSLMLLLKKGDLMELIGAARAAGIQLGQGAQCIPYTGAYGPGEGFPVAHRCEQQGFVVPLYAGLPEQDVDHVIAFLTEQI